MLQFKTGAEFGHGGSVKQTVFIASSSEGLGFAATVEELLAHELHGNADIRRWDAGTFEPTKTYIESLEKQTNEADFAVLVLTKDDEQTVRGDSRYVPRDNVIFELGLFIAALGRERTFCVQEDNLKIPTDLMGIESPKFQRTEDLHVALSRACAKLAQAIRQAIQELPPRIKLTPLQREIQKSTRTFCYDIAGTWWERISFNGEVDALGFFTIYPDESNSVSLEGKAYDKDNGRVVAEWHSLAARVENRTITYARECSHSGKGMSTAPMPGFASMTFERPQSPNLLIIRGFGRFWQNEEAHPERSRLKVVDLCRVSNEHHARIMREGSETETKGIVLDVLHPASKIF
jgi:hypothetical protein